MIEIINIMMIQCYCWVLLACTVSSMFIEVGISQTKCFLMTVFPKQNLLIQVQTPILKQRTQVRLQVLKTKQFLYNQVLKKTEERITVPMAAQTSNNYEVQTCIGLEGEQPSTQKYLVSLKQFRNFDHLVSNDRTEKQLVEIEEINKMADKISSVYSEQIEIFRTNEAQESQNSAELEGLKNSSFVYSIIETALIIGFTIGEIALISQYL